MALVTPSSRLSRNYSLSTEVSVFGTVSRSRLDLVSFNSSPVLWECSVSCSLQGGRERPAGGNSVSDWVQLGSRSRGKGGEQPARAIKINREPAAEKEEDEDEDKDYDDDNELCPVECVREFKSRSEFDDILQYAKDQNSLVVVDFFKTACGSCRYIEKGFVKLCKGAGNTDVSVIFLKHNVMDEYEEQSEVAEGLKIRVVPLFHFYKDGQLVESFATREKTKILETICKHTGLQQEDVAIPKQYQVRGN